MWIETDGIWFFRFPGLGVTPFASILKHIWYRQKRGTLKSLRRVEFFWICRDSPSFGWFQSLLQEVEAAQADRELHTSQLLSVLHICPNCFVVHSANFLRINIYLTQKIGEDMLWNIAVNDAGAEYDPLTLLRTRTMFGRPDWNSIYSRVKDAIESGNYLPGSKSQLKTKVAVCLNLLRRFTKSGFTDETIFILHQTYFCGPPPIAKALKEATIKHSSANVNFTFAKEHF